MVTKPDYHVVSFSGGKDSTAMLLHMLELGIQVDEIIFSDTTVEFPALYEHIASVEKYISRKVTRLQADHDFEYMAFEKTVPNRDPKYGNTKGYGWASPMNRWCTKELKTVPREKHLRQLKEKYNIIHYVGIAADEGYRLKRKNNMQDDQRHPLVEWQWTEAMCLKYCYEKGFNWSGLYEIFNRVSCWCCPLQRTSSLRMLRRQFPQLWQKLREWDKRAYTTFKMGHITVEDFERKFAKEDLQQELF